MGAAIKETFTQEHHIPYSDDPDTPEIESTKVEYGIESSTDVTLKLNQIILWTSKLDLFSTLQRIDEVDILWDNLITAKIDKYISVNLNTQLLYDKDISFKRQFKQILSFGLSYSFY